jgi:hypothetical protein
VELEVVLSRGWDRDGVPSGGIDRIVGLVVEDEGDRAGVDDEATPDAVGDTVSTEEPCRHAAVVEDIGGADVFESVG